MRKHNSKKRRRRMDSSFFVSVQNVLCKHVMGTVEVRPPHVLWLAPGEDARKATVRIDAAEIANQQRSKYVCVCVSPLAPSPLLSLSTPSLSLSLPSLKQLTALLPSTHNTGFPNLVTLQGGCQEEHPADCTQRWYQGTVHTNTHPVRIRFFFCFFCKTLYIHVKMKEQENSNHLLPCSPLILARTVQVRVCDCG